jgi:GNAT superfamily N-acetyltransferase
VRAATVADLPLLLRHRRGMWEDMGRLAPGEPDSAEPAYAQFVAERLAEGRLAGFVAEDGGEPVASGCVYLQEVHPRPGLPETRWAYLLSFYVEPAHRRTGIAGELLEACLAWGRTHGCTRASLHASAAGRPLYERRGFRATTELWLDLPPQLKETTLISSGAPPR